ncbi:MAG TPA: glycosyltransferase family 4 protein [Ramlibacter sp.]|nr:glycosyltransferase family 4 protein [Ramlibacter sp.]
MSTRVLMVTRETGEDRRYGLGRSVLPLFEPMHALGVQARYFCQEDMPAAASGQRAQWSARIATLPGVRGRVSRQNLVNAWLERLQVGHAAARLATREGYTHVHAHDPWLACGVAWGLGMNAARIRWGFTQHGFGSYSHATHEDGLTQGPSAQAWLRRIERFLCARAGWVTAPTALSLQQLARDLGLPRAPAHWHHVPHARPALVAADAARKQQARQDLGYGADDIVVLAVGRLVPLKCFDHIVRACAGQPDARVRLLLLGGGPTEWIEALARELGFGDRLRIASAQDVGPYYHAADIYVSASATESFGMANLEALCAGLPAICSAVGGVPEVVGDAAWLVTNDVPTLTRSLAALAADAQLRDLWSRRGIERAASWPTAQEIAQRYVAIYQAA